MKFRPFALLACLVTVVGLSACQEDPTADGDGVPQAIQTDRTELHQAVGTKFTVKAFAIDQNLRRIPGILDASPAGSAVSLDSVRYDNTLAETRIFLTAVSASSAGTTVTVSGHGLSTDVTIII